MVLQVLVKCSLIRVYRAEPPNTEVFGTLLKSASAIQMGHAAFTSTIVSSECMY